jgi:glutamyl/glutaminyl-tRNA synthetase
MGWNPGNDQEIISLDEMIKLFSLEKLQKGGAVFNMDKLKWINKQYLKLLPIEEVGKGILSFFTDDLRVAAQKSPDVFKKMVPTILAHINVFSEVRPLVDEGEFGYYFDDPTYDKDGLFGKEEKDAATTSAYLDKVINSLENIDPANFTAQTTTAAIWDHASEVGRGKVLWPMRYALSGRAKSADPFTLADILGKDTTIRRITYAMKLLAA